MIEKCLSRYKCFGGVYPKNVFKKKHGKSCFVLNTDLHTGSGIHWVSLYVKKNCVIFFDSFGRNPMEDKWLKKNN